MYLYLGLTSLAELKIIIIIIRLEKFYLNM